MNSLLEFLSEQGSAGLVALLWLFHARNNHKERIAYTKKLEDLARYYQAEQAAQRTKLTKLMLKLLERDNNKRSTDCDPETDSDY